MSPVSAGMPAAHRRQQPVLPHQPQHPVLADPDPLGRKPRFHLPVALAEERTRLQHRPDLFHQLLVAQGRLRAPLPGLPAIGRSGESPSLARRAYTLERATRHVSHTIVSG